MTDSLPSNEERLLYELGQSVKSCDFYIGELHKAEAENERLRADLRYIHSYMHDDVCEQAAAGDEPTECDHGHCYAYWRIGAKLNA